MTENENIAELNRQIREVLKRVDAIHDKLIGTDLHPIGMIQDLEGVKKDVKELQDFKKSIKWTATGMLLATGYAGVKIIQGIIKFFSQS